MPLSDDSWSLLHRIGPLLQSTGRHEARFLYQELQAHLEKLEERAGVLPAKEDQEPDSGFHEV